MLSVGYSIQNHVAFLIIKNLIEAIKFSKSMPIRNQKSITDIMLLSL